MTSACPIQVAVSTNMAQKFADLHSMPLFETSAMDESESDHIEAIFLTLAHKLKSSKPMMTVSPWNADHGRDWSRGVNLRHANDRSYSDSSCPC